MHDIMENVDKFGLQGPLLSLLVPIHMKNAETFQIFATIRTQYPTPDAVDYILQSCVHCTG